MTSASIIPSPGTVPPDQFQPVAGMHFCSRPMCSAPTKLRCAHCRTRLCDEHLYRSVAGVYLCRACLVESGKNADTVAGFEAEYAEILMRDPLDRPDVRDMKPRILDYFEARKAKS